MIALASPSIASSRNLSSLGVPAGTYCRSWLDDLHVIDERRKELLPLLLGHIAIQLVAAEDFRELGQGIRGGEKRASFQGDLQGSPWNGIFDEDGADECIRVEDVASFRFLHRGSGPGPPRSSLAPVLSCSSQR
jgi:hypothetical protein